MFSFGLGLDTKAIKVVGHHNGGDGIDAGIDAGHGGRKESGQHETRDHWREVEGDKVGEDLISIFLKRHSRRKELRIRLEITEQGQSGNSNSIPGIINTCIYITVMYNPLTSLT